MNALSDYITDLTVPFPSDQIDLKPGALTKSKDRALAMAYADSRVYQDRLDQVVGSAGWSVTYQVTPDGVICTLTIFDVTKADVGDFPADYGDKANENRVTTAAAQAFKRACAAFGIGRYLYHLPRTWADYDAERKLFCDPQGVVVTLYNVAGLAAFIADAAAPPAPSSHAESPPAPHGDAAPAPQALPRPDPQRLATARAALASAERAAAPSATTSDGASDAQLGLIARLIISLRQQAEDEADVDDAIDAIGEPFQLDDFSSLTSKEKLRARALSKRTASALIQRLKALETPLTAAA
jgi:hypothetical protein